MMEEFRIKEYRESLQLLEELKQQVENGEILSILYVAERTDGCLGGGCTSTQNVYTLCGYMLAWAMRRMGFIQNKEAEKDDENDRS